VDAIEAMKTRRSIRSYEPGPVDRSVIEDIIDCARLAPTAINIQPWEFIVVTEKDKLRRIAEMTDYGRFIADATFCVAVLCKDTNYYLEDGCAATQNILLAAHAYGLGACWVAGDKKSYAKAVAEFLGAPADYKLVSLVPVGRARPSGEPSKRPLHEVLHWEKL